MISGSTSATRYLLPIKFNMALLVLNLIGAVVYTIEASASWANPSERAAGIYSIAGEPYVWFAAVLMFFAPFALFNAIWGALILIYRQWRGGWFWLATVPIWFIAFVIDFAHH